MNRDSFKTENVSSSQASSEKAVKSHKFQRKCHQSFKIEKRPQAKLFASPWLSYVHVKIRSPIIKKQVSVFQLLNFQLLHYTAGATAAMSFQSCLTLPDPVDGSPPGSPIPGILQARTLEWVAISFSNSWKWKVKVKSLSRVRLFATPWTAAYQAPRSMGFSRQEYWSGVPLPSHITLF